MIPEFDYGSVLDAPLGPVVRTHAHGGSLMGAWVPSLEAVFGEPPGAVNVGGMTWWVQNEAASSTVAEMVKLVDATSLRHPKDNYRAMSVMQKAVRLNDYEMACRAMAALVNGGHHVSMWKRLRVIAVEDVGLGDPHVAAMTVWLAGQKELQKEVGHKPLAASALLWLCTTMKSRDMQDVATWQDLPGVYSAKTKQQLASLESPALIEMALDPELSFRERHAAMRCLFPARWGQGTPWKKRPSEVRLELYKGLKMPPVMAAMIEWDVANGGDVLTSAGPICWALLSASPTISSADDPLDPGGEFPKVNKVYGSAYDRHTYTGKKAIGIWFNKVPELQAFFKAFPGADPLEALYRGVFYVEGSILRPKLVYEGSEDLYWSILEDKLVLGNKLPNLKPAGLQMLQLVQENLPRLNDIRQWLDDQS